MAIISADFRHWRLTVSCLCCLISTASISGRWLQKAQSTSAQSVKPATLRVDVDTVIVDAIVLDKKGDPIRNLAKNNFHLFEDGKEQEIATFEEVTEDSGAGVVNLGDVDGSRLSGGKMVLILFDDSHISGPQYRIARESAEKYVKEHMRPQNLFAVASFDISLRIQQIFTHDAARVLDAIRRPMGSAEPVLDPGASTTSAASRDSQRLGRSQETQRNTLSSYQTMTYRAAPLLQSLAELNSSLAQIRGRKAVLLYSEDFSAGANIHGDFVKTVDSARNANVAFYTVDARGLNSADGGGVLSVGQQSGGNISGSTRGRQARGAELDWNQFEKIPMENILRPLAKETGGLAIYNTSDMNQLLDEVDRELSNYYVLGFQSSNLTRDGKFRTLDVKVDVKGATVKHRNGYVDPHPPDALSSSKEEKILMNALASQTPAKQLPVTMRSTYIYESPGLARVPVSAKIQAGSLELKKKGGQLAGSLDIMGIACSEGGGIVARFSEAQRLLVDKGQEAAFRNRTLTYRNYFRLRPGRYQLKLAISNEQGKVGSAEQALTVPPMPKTGMAASALIVADQVSRLPALIQNLQSGLLEENDPLTFNGLQISPAADTQFAINTPIQVFFKLYNLVGDPQQRKFHARVQLLDGSGREIQGFPPTPLNRNVFPAGKSEAIVGIPLLFDKAIPDNYKLVIVATEAVSNQSVTVQTDLQFR